MQKVLSSNLKLRKKNHLTIKLFADLHEVQKGFQDDCKGVLFILNFYSNKAKGIKVICICSRDSVGLSGTSSKRLKSFCYSVLDEEDVVVNSVVGLRGGEG